MTDFGQNPIEASFELPSDDAGSGFLTVDAARYGDTVEGLTRFLEEAKAQPQNSSLVYAMENARRDIAFLRRVDAIIMCKRLPGYTYYAAILRYRATAFKFVSSAIR